MLVQIGPGGPAAIGWKQTPVVSSTTPTLMRTFVTSFAAIFTTVTSELMNTCRKAVNLSSISHLGRFNTMNTLRTQTTSESASAAIFHLRRLEPPLPAWVTKASIFRRT